MAYARTDDGNRDQREAWNRAALDFLAGVDAKSGAARPRPRRRGRSRRR